MGSVRFCFCVDSNVVLYPSFHVSRPQTQQQVNSSRKELHVWQQWPSLLFRLSPLLFFHILALVAPRLLCWHQVRCFSCFLESPVLEDLPVSGCGSVLFSVTGFGKSAVSKSFGIPSQVVRTSLYFKLQACLYLLDLPLSTLQKSPRTRRPLLAGAATPQTPPTTWCPPLRPSRAPKSFRRRPLGGPPTFTRTTRRPRWRGWYVPTQQQE